MQKPRTTRTAPLAGSLATVVGVILWTVAGCTMVGDLTGVKLRGLNAISCPRQCNLDNQVLVQAERELHLANVEECQATYPPGDPLRSACLEAESARHDAEMERLARELLACQSNCHRQGSGSAG